MTTNISALDSVECHVATIGPRGDAKALCFNTVEDACRYLKRVGAMPTRNPRRKSLARRLLSIVIMGPGDQFASLSEI